MKNLVFLAAFLSALCIPSIQGVEAAAQGEKATLRRAIPPSPRPGGYLPALDQPDIHENHKRIADEIVRLLPRRCRSSIRNFYVRYDRKLPSRGYASSSSVIMRGDLPESEFRAVLVHEVLGHFADLSSCIAGSPASGASTFRDGDAVIYRDDPSVGFYAISWARSNARRPRSRDADFVSGYAMHDAFEDAAETVTFYVFHERVFRERARTNYALARKLAWVETNLFPNGALLAESAYDWDGREIPWDVTKLPYAWHTEKRIARR